MNKEMEKMISLEKEKIFQKYKEKVKGVKERYKIDFDLEYEPTNQLKIIRFKIPKYYDLENLFIAYHFKLKNMNISNVII